MRLNSNQIFIKGTILFFKKKAGRVVDISHPKRIRNKKITHPNKKHEM